VVCIVFSESSNSITKQCGLDAGVHPAHSGMASLPFIDELDWSTVDAILVTQLVLLSTSFLNSVVNVLSQLPFGSCCRFDVHHGEGAVVSPERTRRLT
jgi:hypothetical protein